MSSPLAIGAVSAVLRNLLDNGLVEIDPPISPVNVTAIAPDRIDLEDTSASPSLNLFLYRTSLNQGWAGTQLPAFDGNGARLTHPPLALNLHYLLTAYGMTDFQAEILLGYAMHVLHERPVLDRAAITAALQADPLDASILPPAFQAVKASDLAEQLDAVTITQEPMDTEQMSRLWSAIQTKYRPTASYLVSVVLIEARKPSRTALPVLSRGLVDEATGRDRGVVVEPSLLPPYPTIVRVVPEHSQPAARLGETVRLDGHHLSGASLVVRFAHRLLDEPNEITMPTNADSTGIDLTLPSGPGAEEDWPAGVYLVSVSLVRPDETDPRVTNVAAMLLAPVPQLPPTGVTRDADRTVTVTLDVKPLLRPAQDALLTLGVHSALVEPHGTTAVGTLTFKFGDVPEGDRWVRLSVDSVESLLLNRLVEPPAFDPSQFVTVPA